MKTPTTGEIHTLSVSGKQNAIQVSNQNIHKVVTLEQIRTIALNLPGVTESLHFRLPTFKVGDKGFVTVQKDAAIMALPLELCEALSADEPEIFELVIRNKKYFVGLKINLQPISIHQLKPLIEKSYEYKKLEKK